MLLSCGAVSRVSSSFLALGLLFACAFACTSEAINPQPSLPNNMGGSSNGAGGTLPSGATGGSDPPTGDPGEGAAGSGSEAGGAAPAAEGGSGNEGAMGGEGGGGGAGADTSDLGGQAGDDALGHGGNR